MADHQADWFSVSPPGSTSLRCAACGQEIDLAFPSADHHPAWCPACQAECVFLSWKESQVQILTGRAPPELVRLIRWAQRELDELEFVTLLCGLAQIVDAVQAKAEPLRHA